MKESLFQGCFWPLVALTLGGKVGIVLTSSHSVSSLFQLTWDLHCSYS